MAAIVEKAAMVFEQMQIKQRPQKTLLGARPKAYVRHLRTCFFDKTDTTCPCKTKD
jgi:hypothetical protein